MRLIVALGASMALAGCAAQVISSSERTVVVKARIQDVSDAQKLADTECAKYGRKARLANKATINQYIYDCER